MLIIKIGGNDIDDPPFLVRFTQAVVKLPDIPVIVHGGGKEIAALQTLLGLKPQFINGLRVTDEESLQVAQMVLCGRINQRLVAAFEHAGGDAMGLSGADRGLLAARKLKIKNGDLGFVGLITRVKATVLLELTQQTIIPVVAPIAWSRTHAFNINADSCACAIAKALMADELMFVTNVPGVMRDKLTIPSLTPKQAQTLIHKNIITGGMLPKVRSAIKAVQSGVPKVRITSLDGLGQNKGTIFTPDKTHVSTDKELR